MKQQNLNDIIEDIVIKLWDDETFTSYLHALYDAQAVEGSILDDEIMAVQMIRNYAIKHCIDKVAAEKLANIRKGLRTVLRRYGQSHKERLERWISRDSPDCDFIVDASGEVHPNRLDPLKCGPQKRE